MADDSSLSRRAVLAGTVLALAGCTTGDPGGRTTRTTAGTTGRTTTAATTTQTTPTTSDPTTTTTERPTTTTTRPTTTQEWTDPDGPRVEAALGERVEGDGLTLVVRGVTEASSLPAYGAPASGRTFAAVRVAVANAKREFRSVGAFPTARVVDGDGAAYGALLDTPHPLTTGVFAPGEVVRGDVAFAVPADAENFTLELDATDLPGVDAGTLAVPLDGATDAPADVSADLGVKRYEMHDTLTYGDLQVTLDGFRTAGSAGAGHEFVVPTMAVRNNTAEAVSAAALRRTVVKDDAGLTYGVHPDATAKLASRLDADALPAGRSRVADLAYRVPADAKPLYVVFDYSVVGAPSRMFWTLR